MADALVAVEHRHRQQHRAELPGAEEDRGGLRRRRQDDGHPVAALHARRRPARAAAWAARSCSSPQVSSRARAVEALVHHRELVARVLVADVGGDVVALGHLPAVRGDGLLVGHRPASREPGGLDCDRTQVHQVPERDVDVEPVQPVDGPQDRGSAPRARGSAGDESDSPSHVHAPARPAPGRVEPGVLGPAASTSRAGACAAAPAAAQRAGVRAQHLQPGAARRADDARDPVVGAREARRGAAGARRRLE